MAEQPNILLVVLDAARADLFEPYGAVPGSSPAVAGLAARGVTLDGYATACWTVPSHSSMFTGLLPRQLGLGRLPDGRPAGAKKQLKRFEDRLLAEVLRRNGYRTRGVSANFWLSEMSGFDTGFDDFVPVEAGRHARMQGEGLRDRLHWGAEAVKARADDGASAARIRIKDWVTESAKGDQPWFQFVNLIECHSPYLPQRPYNPLGPVGRWKAAREAREYLNLHAIWGACMGGVTVPPDVIERMRALYQASAKLLDDWLAQVMDDLDQAGQLDSTTIIVTADHGENIGEDGLMGHAFSLDERILRVPLIVAGPGAAQRSGLTSVAEIPSLIAEAIGLDDHPWAPEPRGSDLPIAVAQFDPPVDPGDERIQIALDGWGLDESHADKLTTPITAASDGRFKVVRTGTSEEMFRTESPNLAEPTDEVPTDLLERLRAALDSGEAAVPTIEVSGPAETPEDEAAALEEKMRQLGYM